MKQLIKKLIVCSAGVIISATALAQRNQPFTLALNYNVAVPVSETFKDYVSKTSFRGFQGAILYRLDEQFRLGLQVTFNDFYEKYGRQVYKTSDGADISAVLSNTLQSLPVLVKGEYSFGKPAGIRPYIGLGAGINFVNFDQYYGEFQYSKYSTKAAFSGDLGVLIPFSSGSNYGARVSTSYNLTPFNEEGIKNITTWNVQAGIVVPLR
jgi:hypothetical protein